MPTKVEICNQALLKLGQPPIMSLQDDSIPARRCNQEFDSALGVVLRAYPWPFAIKRVSLALSSETPTFGYANYFIMPRDIAIINELDTGGYKYQIEGHAIATDASTVNLRYCSKDIDVAQFDDQTVEVLALQLAYRLCIATTENINLKDMLFAEYNEALKVARNIWSVEDYPQEVEEGTWLTSRSGATGIPSVYNPWGPNGTGGTE